LLFRDALDRYRRRGEADRLQALHARYNLALLELVQGKTAEAGREFADLLADAVPKLGEKHPLVVEARRLAALVPKVKADGDRYQQTLTARGGDHPDTLAARSRLAAVLRDYIDVRYAALHAEAVLAARRRLLPAAHPDTVEAMHRLANMYLRLKRKDEAVTLEREALAAARLRKGDGDPFTRRLAEEILKYFPDELLAADARAVVGLNLLADGEYEEAEKTMRACLKIRTAQTPDDWATFEAKSLLGEELLGRKQYEQAEPLLLAGYEGMSARAAKAPRRAEIGSPRRRPGWCASTRRGGTKLRRGAGVRHSGRGAARRRDS
jgi:hypothetical protein